MPRPPSGSAINASPALLALRRGAVISSLIVALAVVAQTLAFAFVHFTEVRFEAAPAAHQEQSGTLSVVEAGPRKPIELLKSENEPSESRAPGKGDAVLGAMANIASGVGVIALAVLVAQCWMATAIAAGAGVVGMQRAVRAASIVTALFGMSVPWTSAIPSATIWGVFCGYQPLVTASADVASGVQSEFVALTLHAILPIIILGLLVWAIVNLSVGISAGIIRTVMDPVVEAEIAAVQQHGAGSLYAARSSGDLDRAMIAPNVVTPIRIAGDNEADRAMAELEKLAGRRRPGDEPLRPTGTDPLRRPI